MRALTACGVIVTVTVTSMLAAPAEPFTAYGSLLSAVVKDATVDYSVMQRDRRLLDEAVASFRASETVSEPSWGRAERFAFWINAYNAFTIAAIVDHYPIHGSWFSLAPRNSIRQIDGVWTRLKWRAAARDVTLDQIEHEILRPKFKDPRVHFAINCASASCPPLHKEPYVARRLDAQLDDAARRYLATRYGLQVDGDRLKVSSIFKWYGDDFIDQYAQDATTIEQKRPPRDRAILGFVAHYGPAEAVAAVKSGRARIEFLRYDWSLNDREP